jgi:NAD(P)-dependent dehydrogenase (short-subunit alcohol dehydrogenase family)
MMQNQRVALVTGANQGLGLQIARVLAANDYTVLVGARNLENGELAAQSIGTNAHALQLDVTVEASIKAAAQRIRMEFGRLDLLVNNAGISNTAEPGTSYEQLLQAGRASIASLAEVRAIFETNVFGVIATTQQMLPLLREAPAARIVNISSGLGSLTLNADPSFPYRQVFSVGYAASKTALNAITLAFAIELESTTIKVNAVSPGFAATALNNFAGTETVEQAARAPINVALDENGPTGKFISLEGPLPW